jgi:ankyrin repeat protein
MRSADEGYTEVVKRLIEAKADVNAANKIGRTALMVASKYGRTEVVKLLIDATADVNHAEKEGWTALMWASQKGHTEVVKLLIAAKADVNAADKDGETSLMRASLRGHIELVRILLAAGARVNTDTEGTLLNILCRKGWEEDEENEEGNSHKQIRLLLSYGAKSVDIENDPRIGLETKEIIADIRKSIPWLVGIQEKESFEIMVDTNIAQAKTEEGYTSLMAAVERGDIDLIKRLLSQGAPINAKDRAHRTALMLACQKGNKEIVQCLLDGGADMHVLDGMKRSLLAWTTDIDTVKVLLARGLVAMGNEKLTTDIARYVDIHNMLEGNHHAYARAEKVTVDDVRWFVGKVSFGAQVGYHDLLNKADKSGASGSCFAKEYAPKYFKRELYAVARASVTSAMHVAQYDNIQHIELIRVQSFLEGGHVPEAIQVLLSMKEVEDPYLLKYQRQSLEEAIIQCFGRLYHTKMEQQAVFNLLRKYMSACVKLKDSVDPTNYVAEDADQYAQLILCLDEVHSNTNHQDNLATIQAMYRIVSSMMSKPNGCKEIVGMGVLCQATQKFAHLTWLPYEITASITRFEQQLWTANRQCGKKRLYSTAFFNEVGRTYKTIETIQKAEEQGIPLRRM